MTTERSLILRKLKVQFSFFKYSNKLVISWLLKRYVVVTNVFHLCANHMILSFHLYLGHTCTCAMHSICVYKKQDILNYTWTSGTVHALHFIGVKRKNAKGIAGSLRVKILIFYYFHFREQPHIEVLNSLDEG